MYIYERLFNLVINVCDCLKHTDTDPQYLENLEGCDNEKTKV